MLMFQMVQQIPFVNHRSLEYEREQGTIIGPKAFSLEEGVPELFRFFGGAVVAAASFSAWWNRVPWKGPFKRAEFSLIS